MQLFVRDVSTVALDLLDPGSTTVRQLKAQFTLKAYGVEAPDSWVSGCKHDISP